jgi:hypothetical protein
MNEDGMPTKEEIEVFQKQGHTFHCAMRILTGDGECECGKKSTVTPGFSGLLYGDKCAVCLCVGNNHKDWCRIGKGGK